MKNCRNCGEIKPLSAFYTHPQMADGHLNICKDCTKARVRKRAKNNPTVIEQDRRRNRSPHRKQAVASRQRENRVQANAKNAVYRAIKRQEMAPPSACICADCGRTTAQVLHHHSYDCEHWLDVVPLCRSCHGIRHAYPQRFAS